MADWTITRPIDYSPNGDDVDSFSQKVKYTLEQIYECLQVLRTNGAQAGLGGVATPYEIRIDTTTGYIYIRNADNTQWLLLGEVGNYFGITPETISGVRNGGGLGKISCGKDSDKPTVGNESHDIYFAEDSSIAYMWTGTAWKNFLSLNFEDILNYERYCVSREELTTIGGLSNAGKVLQLDRNTGKANVDIAGSPDMLWGYFIDFQDLKDGDIVAFDAAKKKFVNKPTIPSAGGSSAYVTDDLSVNYLKRLVGELHLALVTAELDTTGYDSMLTEVFYSNSEEIDTAEVDVTSIVMGSSALQVSSLADLIIGANYQLTDGNNLQDVKIATMKIENDRSYVTLTENVRYPFSNATKLRRANGTFQEGYITGDGVSFVTNPISFVNEATGDSKNISKAHLNVKHENVIGAEISAEIALINNPTFVSREVIAIGNDVTQQATLAHTENLSSWGFKLFFDGIEQQASSYVFSPSDGKVTFFANNGVIVQASYFYNWSEENFIPFEKSGVYCDKKNNERATTQFVYQAANASRTGSVAVIRLKLNQAAGGESSRILGTATGSPQAFKLPYHALESSIQVMPASATWNWNGNLDVLTVTAPHGQQISVSYNFKSKPFKVDSFAVMFNE